MEDSHPQGLTGQDIAHGTRKYNIASWTAQDQWHPISMARAEGVYFWDYAGKRYLDWSAQMINVNIGHGNGYVNQAIKDSLDRISFASPAVTTEVRMRAGQMLAEVTPPNHTKSFFTTGGADANENALKIARLFTGREKIIGRYRAYHGSTFAAMSAGGDPRRLPNEPGVPWVVRVHDPFAYRNPIYAGRSQEEGDAVLVAELEETIRFEGPERIAGIIVEGYSASSGAFDGSDVYWEGVQRLCDKYGILLIVDEVASGFGRTGKWFGFEHHAALRPDIIAMSKGLTSAYVPMGAVSVSDEIAAHFDKNTLWAGLTYNAHPLGCAAAVAVMEVMHRDGLVDHAARMGEYLSAGLAALAGKHACVGEARGRGLLQVLDLVSDTQTREPLSPFHQPPSEAMRRIKARLLENGLSPLIRWNWIFAFPPLIIEKGQIDDALEILDDALEIGDGYVTG